jgi:hypothetical protein
VLVLLCSNAGSASASFPGGNGAIAYSWASYGKFDFGGSPTSIRAVDPRGGLVQVLRDCRPRTDEPVMAPDCAVGAPRYSPDGLRIAFPSSQLIRSGRFLEGLGIMASDGTGFEERASPSFPEQGYPGANGYTGLAWSPAGDQLLLERQLALPVAERPHAILLALLDGTELAQVTPAWTQDPDWSSRGEIAFVRYRSECTTPAGCANIFLTRLGGSQRRLTYRGGHSPSWSPHGKKLAFVRSGGRRRAGIYLVRRDGRGLRRLTRRGAGSPVWSPDGKWIAFIRAGDLYVVRTDGRGLRRLVDELGPDPEYGLGPQVTSLDWQAIPRR